MGGGPTGVEVAAELHDMVVDDLRKVSFVVLFLFLPSVRIITLRDC